MKGSIFAPFLAALVAWWTTGSAVVAAVAFWVVVGLSLVVLVMYVHQQTRQP